MSVLSSADTGAVAVSVYMDRTLFVMIIFMIVEGISVGIDDGVVNGDIASADVVAAADRGCVVTAVSRYV